MANPIVYTKDNLLEYTNSAARFYGQVVKNGWEVTAWGFYYYETANGIEESIYTSSGTDFEETIFQKFTSGGPLSPNTNYTWRARAYFKKWNDETESWDYIEQFGDWESFTTEAWCQVSGIYIDTIDKENGTAYFSTMLWDSDESNCEEVGFEYGTSRTTGQNIVKTTEGISVDYSFVRIQVTGLSLNQDFYVRAYAKSLTGNVIYNGGMTAEDENWLGGWRKFTTKELVGKIAITENCGYDYNSIPHEFLSILDENGEETNAWYLQAIDTYPLSVDNKDGSLRALIGHISGSQYRIGGRRFENGYLGWSGMALSDDYFQAVFYHSDGYVYTVNRVGSGSGAVYWLRKREPDSLSTIVAEYSFGIGTRHGLAIDSDNYIYVCNTASYEHHKIQKYSIPEDPEETSLVLEAQIEVGGSNPLTYGNLAVTSTHVYAGAWFDKPRKANKALTSYSVWSPSGNWDDPPFDNFFYVAMYEGQILVEGTCDGAGDFGEYSRAIALYDEDENLIWQVVRNQGLDGMGGMPYPSIEVTTNAATQINYEWAMGNGEITSGTNATERGFEIKVDFVGSIYWELEYQFAGFEVEGELEIMVWTTNDFGELGFWSVGTMIKTESEDGDFEEGEFSIILGHEKPGFPGEGEGYLWDRLFPCKTYEYRAYAVIDGETYYGEWVEFSTLCDSGGEQQPSDDISDGNPTEPIIPISPIEEEPYPPFEWEEPEEIPYPPWDIDIPELPPWVLPELPEWDIPDYPVPSFVGDFYYKRPYTKKDIDELRKKCIIYNKNSIEFALVLRHNMNVLREFLNMMTEYLGTDEFNDFTDLVPPQNLKELYLDPITPDGFRTIINGFINNTVNNNMAVNRNFKLLTDGLSDYTTSEDASFREITSSMKRIDEDNPDVHRMKQHIDNLNHEVAANFNNVMYNLNVVRARLL